MSKLAWYIRHTLVIDNYYLSSSLAGTGPWGSFSLSLCESDIWFVNNKIAKNKQRRILCFFFFSRDREREKRAQKTRVSGHYFQRLMHAELTDFSLVEMDLSVGPPLNWSQPQKSTLELTPLTNVSDSNCRVSSFNPLEVKFLILACRNIFR